MRKLSYRYLLLNAALLLGLTPVLSATAFASETQSDLSALTGGQPLLALNVTQSVYGPSGTDPSAQVHLSGPASVHAGDSFDMKLSLAGITGSPTTAKITIHYTAAQLQYGTAAPIGTDITLLGANDTLGTLSLVVGSLNGEISNDTPLLSLSFLAKSEGVHLSEITASVEWGQADDGSVLSGAVSSASLRIATGLPGDLNANHAVDVGDLALLIKNYGMTDTSDNWSQVSEGDLNHNGIIDLPDLAGLGRKVLYDNGQPFQLMEADIMGIQNAMEAGKLTSVQLVQMYLDRIQAYDKQGPNINAVISVNPDALAAAAALDQERKEKGARGLLHGIPIVVKDNYDTTGMPTSAGCTCLRDNQTVSDAYMVQKLKDAGAIVLAKVNLSEFAINTDTYSSLGGQTHNPYNLQYNPGGSSGGTGASLASNFAVGGLGTDTGGSIRIPSSYNSIVGIRPTIGLTSRDGIIPLALSQDVGGPMARTVADAAIMLDAVSGYDPNDVATAASIGRKPVSYTNYLDKNGLKGARIGLIVDNSVRGTNAEVRALMDQAVADMQAQGATVVNVNLPNVQTIMGYSSLSAYEFKYNLNDYLSNPRFVDSNVIRYHSLTDIINSVNDFDPRLKSTLTTRDGVAPLDTNQQYKDILLYRNRMTQDSLLKVMADNQLDALLYPSTTGPVKNGAGSANRLSPFSGFPAISVPAGYVADGTPIGLELLGRPYEEGTIIKLGYAYEQATHHRVAPAATPALAP